MDICKFGFCYHFRTCVPAYIRGCEGKNFLIHGTYTMLLGVHFKLSH